MMHAWLGPYRHQPGPAVTRGNELDRAPQGSLIGRCDHANDRVGPAQPLVQPVLPLVPHHDTVAQIPIEEDFVTVLDQPSMHLSRQTRIRAGVADEYPRHGYPSLSSLFPEIHIICR